MGKDVSKILTSLSDYLGLKVIAYAMDMVGEFLWVLSVPVNWLGLFASD